MNVCACVATCVVQNKKKKEEKRLVKEREVGEKRRGDSVIIPLVSVALQFQFKLVLKIYLPWVPQHLSNNRPTICCLVITPLLIFYSK